MTAVIACPLCGRPFPTRPERMEHLVADHDDGIERLIDIVEAYERQILYPNPRRLPVGTWDAAFLAAVGLDPAQAARVLGLDPEETAQIIAHMKARQRRKEEHRDG